MKKKKYEEQLEGLYDELVDLQHWMIQTGQRVVVLLEGRDAAGKGGVIKAIEAPLNNRYVRTVSLPKPSEREATQWYFQRYAAHLPAAGELVLFDRSWYNRAGVEHVMGYCSPDQYQRFLVDCPVFEDLLAADGIVLFKYWLTVDQAQQEERFAERASDPRKRWKLSPIDLEARKRYEDYGRARDAMLKATHRPRAPWSLVDFNDQRRGRLNLIHDLVRRLPERTPPDKPLKLPKLARKPARETPADASLWVPETF
ncbi:polyphosphate kinase 2 [Dokdonella koreensis]|uniref:ADP/GDP-polyphosphate phosphotransferase n=1 Tax=Dokdonella koreensis DS-123 TaxID=1300342 RepID=A0A160DVS7_9GAMM|nr:polyphosphate kinase 2 [Dokdonella koreensis]ANB18659.1 Transcriptional regulator [Dokdonella koreensis DS-123]